MHVQEFIADETLRSMEALIRQFKKLPEGKWDWEPMDAGRTARSQVQECAFLAGIAAQVVESGVLPDFPPEFFAEMRTTRESWNTLALLEEKLRERTGDCVNAIRQVPDGDLIKEIQFFGPKPWTMAAIMNFHVWNMHYHTGQICYIQTLLGDKEM